MVRTHPVELYIACFKILGAPAPRYGYGKDYSKTGAVFSIQNSIRYLYYYVLVHGYLSHFIKNATAQRRSALADIASPKERRRYVKNP